jgi:hypothetical protein
MFVVKKRPPQTNQLPNVQHGVHVTHAPPSGSSGKTSYLSYDDIPKSYRDNIKTKFILPIETKLTFALDKLKTLGTKDSQDAIGIITKTIDTNLSDINKNIESIRLAEARVDIANLGLRGFQMKVDFTKGLQLEIVPGSDNYEMFFDFIRKYVFLYKDSEWPPNINKYEYFKYNSSSRELCCFYWPLYAYVKTLFHNDFKGNVDLSDLFSLPRMQKYCTDFFKKQIHKPLVTTSTKKKGQSGGDNKRNKGQGKSQGQGNRGQGKGQGQGNRGQGNRGQGNRKTNTFKPLTVSNKMVSAEAQGCDSSKLSQVEVSLRRTILTSNVSGAIVDRDTEYNALQRIVRTYIRTLKETDLLIGEKSIETFIMDLNPNAPVDFYPDEMESRSKEKIKEKCHGKVKITGDTKCIIDPLVGAVFTYDNLKAWFTPAPKYVPIQKKDAKTGKTKTIGKHPENFTHPCNILINSINMFKENYPLPSPMWKLEMDDLKGIRERFMKVLSFLLITLREMYERLKQENIGSIKDNRKSENELRSFYSKLIQSIENEQDNTKKQKMIRLQDSIEAKYGNLLVK